MNDDRQDNRHFYSGKTVAVTGAASGIGLALCEKLLESGAEKVIMADFSKDKLEKESSRLELRYPGKTEGAVCDVTREDQVQDLINRAVSAGNGHLDLFIQCTGAGLSGRFTLEPGGVDPELPYLSHLLTDADWKQAFDLNFHGPMYGFQTAVPVMISQGCGQIVSVVSGTVFSPMAYQSSEAAASAALLAATMVIREELADYNIRVSAATSGIMTDTAFKENGEDGTRSTDQFLCDCASRILSGIENNKRLIPGDDRDLDGARSCFYPDDAGRNLDRIYSEYARRRRRGNLNLETEDIELIDSRETEILKGIINPGRDEIAGIPQKIRDYALTRSSDNLDRDYYSGKHAVITGAASGIGLGLSRKLLECGAAVLLADCDADRLEEQVKLLSQDYPGRVKGTECDVSSENSVQDMIRTGLDFFEGPLDLLINCAGIGHLGITLPVPDEDKIERASHLKPVTAEQWNKLFAVNFYGPLFGCRAAIPVMLKQGKGQIVNIISGTAFMPMPYQAVYSSTKAALNALSLVLRYEYGYCGIRISSSTPGTVATAIYDGSEIPEGAQSPEQAAVRILTGAAGNERLTAGDDADLTGMIICNNPVFAEENDKWFLNIARSRRVGNLSDYGMD